jgi:hypothetical protein
MKKMRGKYSKDKIALDLKKSKNYFDWDKEGGVVRIDI